MSWNFAYDSPNAITKLLQQQGLSMTKKFGQNFLLSNQVREHLVDLLSVGQGMQVWEIGPGIGALTSLLLSRGAMVTAFEIDHGFCRILSEEAFGDEPNFHLVCGDALKTLFATLEASGCPERLCGNLPYNVGSVVIGKVLESSFRPSTMVFTLQKEVVERLCAAPHSKDWSSFSLLAQMDYEVKQAFQINSGAFYPIPNVTSSVVVFTLRPQSLVPQEHRAAFMLLIRELFSQRRKTIKNNLLGGKVGQRFGSTGVEEILLQANLNPTLRAEALDWEEFRILSASLSNYQAT